MDIMLNRWMLYQTLACRVWARSAFYQASGGYGFRDQLQDGTALALSRPEMTRAHLCAPPRGNSSKAMSSIGGCRPRPGRAYRVSDDRIWLAYAAAHYVETTGDLAVLDERVSFLEGQALRPGETRFVLPACARGRDRVPLRALRARARWEPRRRRTRPCR